MALSRHERAGKRVVVGEGKRRRRKASVNRPFTKQGGVIFAGDEYGESVCWKVDKRAIGKTMEWELKGRLWLTYWPNKHITPYAETRRLEFREVLHLNLA